MANKKFLFCLLIAAIACVFWRTPAFAEDCANASSQSEMDECASQAYTAADQQLNDTYKALMAKISPDGQASLRAAQRAWLTYRDKQCAFEVLGRAGASIYPMVMANCRAYLTTLQTKELNGQLNCEEGDLSCGGQ